MKHRNKKVSNPASRSKSVAKLLALIEQYDRMVVSNARAVRLGRERLRALRRRIAAESRILKRPYCKA